ncbi:urea ABC transporter permease subunit UrtC [Anthocerotibacter panamensis]|uniref:urea ABC transporter permease subunit UrtC n=1 Tax=Anthocerotibacter panamensis TaxID=2857077 RepID=UPI001C403000|nr:urea ABC transporter permease subunit UrtC [Anthocerotibacter panamensis]
MNRVKAYAEWLIFGAVVLVLAVLVPGLLSDFRLGLLGKFLAFAVLALGMDLVWGYTGMLSLGHGVFFGLGAYAMAMHLKLEVGNAGNFGTDLPDFMFWNGVTELPWFWQPFHYFGFTLAMVFVAPGLLAFVLGWLTFRNRIRGVYFSLLTQALAIVFVTLFIGQQGYTGGTNGITDFRTILGFDLSSAATQKGLYEATVVCLALSYLFCRWLTGGAMGKVLAAIRDDEVRVRFAGYDPAAYKVFIFTVSACLAGLAGALFVPQVGIISPTTMGIVPSIEIVIWVAVGGRGTLVGAILGAVLVNAAKSFFSESFPDFWLYLQGSLFLGTVLFLPLGIVGFFQQWFAPKPTEETEQEVEAVREGVKL